MTKPTEVPAAVRQSAISLSEPKPMRRGSISERFVKCSKPGCACATDSEARHGPYYSLTRPVKGKTCSRFVTAEHAETIREQVKAGQEFRKVVEQYWEVCEQWADELLQEHNESPSTEAQKRGSKRRYRRKSSLKSSNS
jgi:hypothetical protein